MKKVLIVDDDQDILESLFLLLRDEGYDVSYSSSGKTALELLRKEVVLPDLIILDMYLSGYDGRDIAHLLKSHDKTRNIPIIMISAHMNAASTIKRSEVDTFIAKPFNITEFLSSVEKYVKPLS